MRNQLVYDLPTRLFHWLFAGLFVFAFAIAKTVDDESLLFSYHMLAGLLLAFVVILRIAWGIVGTKHSRFSSFALHPSDLVKYLSGVFSGDKRRWAGHNPASSWATLIMLILALGLGITGYLMATGQKETFEDVHELLANGFLLIVLLHLVGVALHSLRHQDGISLSMVDGAKSGIETTQVIPSSRPGVGIIFAVLVLSFAMHLAKNFDSQKQTLNFFGSTLQLGENEDENDGDESEEHGENTEHLETDDDD